MRAAGLAAARLSSGLCARCVLPAAPVRRGKSCWRWGRRVASGVREGGQGRSGRLFRSVSKSRAARPSGRVGTVMAAAGGSPLSGRGAVLPEGWAGAGAVRGRPGCLSCWAAGRWIGGARDARSGSAGRQGGCYMLSRLPAEAGEPGADLCKYLLKPSGFRGAVPKTNNLLVIYALP